MLFSLLALFEQKENPQRQTSCQQCGQCCESFGNHLRASRHDLERWRALGRDDLIARANHLGWIWVDPETKQPVAPCPFIVRSDAEHACCSIYEIRPDICRDYPTLAHGKRCLRGVFLSWGTAIMVDCLSEWIIAAEMLPLAA